MVIGTDEGIALATKLNLAALFIESHDDGFVERATPRFEAITAKRSTMQWVGVDHHFATLAY